MRYYRVSWTSDKDLVVHHSGVFTEVQDARNYHDGMAPHWPYVWIERATWSRLSVTYTNT